jgi:DNA-binding MarR family transcriptional regulator
MDRREPSLRDYQTLAAFRVALRRFFDFSASAAAEAGVAPQQYQALLAIKGHAGEGAPSISDLAAQLLVQQHSAVELVKRLEAAGLVSRLRDPQDRRVVLLRLTPKAEAVLASLAAVHLAELRQMAPAIAALLDRVGEDSATPGVSGTE